MDDYDDVPSSADPKPDVIKIPAINYDEPVVEPEVVLEPPPSDELCPDGITLVSAGCPPETKTCWDESIIPITDTCLPEPEPEVEAEEEEEEEEESGDEFADPCDGEYKLQSQFITNCILGKDGDLPASLNCVLPQIEIGGACADPPPEETTKTCPDGSVIPIIEQCVTYTGDAPDPTCEPGYVFSADMVNCEKGPQLIADDLKDIADEIAATLAANTPSSASPSLDAFNSCMEESKTIINLDDPQGALLYPQGNFNACRFPEGNFQSQWIDTGQKDNEGNPIFEEMWNLDTHGLKSAEWYKSQGTLRPTNMSTKPGGGATDGTYHWDSFGNILGGPCCEGDVCGEHGSFKICPSDPDKSIRGNLSVAGGDPNHYLNTVNSISRSLSSWGGTQDGSAFDSGAGSGLILGYRPPRDMEAKDAQIIFAYNELLGQSTTAQTNYQNAQTKADAAKVAADAAQKIIDDAATTAVEKAAAQQILDDAEKERLRLKKQQEASDALIESSYMPVIPKHTGSITSILSDDLTETETKPTPVVEESYNPISLSEGIDSLNTNQADPINLQFYLFGGSQVTGGPATGGSIDSGIGTGTYQEGGSGNLFGEPILGPNQGPPQLLNPQPEDAGIWSNFMTAGTDATSIKKSSIGKALSNWELPF